MSVSVRRSPIGRMNGSEWNVAGQGERQILNRYRNPDGSAGYAFWR
jgi:hypothetical protein